MPHRLPAGLSGRQIFIHATSEDDLLWSAEEVLRVDPTGFLETLPEKSRCLTLGRRLQPATEAGSITSLLLIRKGHGSNSAGMRWRYKSRPAEADSTPLQWQFIKNKIGTLWDWIVEWDGKTSACHMADKAFQ